MVVVSHHILKFDLEYPTKINLMPTRIKQLTYLAPLRNTEHKCLKTRIQSGKPRRQSVVFFTPIAFSTGAMEQKYKTRKGNTARSALYEFSTFAPTNSLENVLVDYQSLTEEHIMAKHVHCIGVPGIFADIKRPLDQANLFIAFQNSILPEKSTTSKTLPKFSIFCNSHVDYEACN